MVLVATSVLLASGTMWGGESALAAGHVHHVSSAHHYSPHHDHDHGLPSVDASDGAAFDMALVEVDDDSCAAKSKKIGDHGVHALHAHISLFLDRAEEFAPRLNQSRLVLRSSQETGTSLTPIAFDKPPRA